MSRVSKTLTIGAVSALALLLGVASAGAAFGFFTSVKPYAVAVDGDYDVKPLISSGDRVPLTSDPAKQFQFVGIPDGLGIYRKHHDRIVLANQELGRTVTSEPLIGQDRVRGAFVSKLVLGRNGAIESGDLAFNKVYNEDTPVGPIATTANGAAAFARFCSGFLANEAVGFSEPIYLTGEESSGSDTFDGQGGQSVAVFDGEAHVLPALGHFPKENQVVLPHTGRKTVILVLEDGPANTDSQLYLYVGTKVPHAKSELTRNGLDNGKLYAFVGGSAVAHEGDLPSGSTTGSWTEIPNADTLTDVQLEAAADAAGAMGFVRIEDGAASANLPGTFHFVTTGANFPSSGPYNKLGRVYRLKLNLFNPTAPAKLTVVVNADQTIAAGGDTALSPDNVDVSGRYLMVQEDGTGESRPVMGAKGRDGSIWRFDLFNGYAAKRVIELDPPGRDGVAVGPGVWETSGIIDTGREFGHGSWLFDVQAHSPTAAPAANTVEDGQILLARPAH